MITHIYLDLDGVLTDFHAEYGNHDKESWIQQFPEFIKRGGFKKLKMLSDAKDLMNFLDSTGIPVTICSSAGGIPEFYHDIVLQKHAWLADHQVKYPAMVVPSKNYKANYAMPTTCLIDDFDQNVFNFWKAGGIGIQHKSAANTIQQLKVAMG